VVVGMPSLRPPIAASFNAIVTGLSTPVPSGVLSTKHKSSLIMKAICFAPD
jgi:hypothetical protein